MQVQLQVIEDPNNFASSKARTFVTKLDVSSVPTPQEAIETATLAAHRLQLKGMRDFAVLNFDSSAYIIHTWSTYMQTQLAVNKLKMPFTVWTRPMDTIWCKSFPLEQADVQEHPTEKSGFFFR